MDIHIAAAAILREDGATLLVRKRGTSAFMQPGGKIDGDESPIEALCRELAEEIGLMIAPEKADYLGTFVAPAANETGCQVRAELFRLQVDHAVTAQAEIEEVRWVLPSMRDSLELAPLTRDVVLPALWGRRAENATPTTFQQRVGAWVRDCFGPEVAVDEAERNRRLLEETLELVQALGFGRTSAHQLVDYVFDRSAGEPGQELGGVMVTLASLAGAQGLDMMSEGERELARIRSPELMKLIREKHAAKPVF